MNNSFSIARTVQLMKHDVVTRTKTIVTTALAVIAILALFPAHITETATMYYRLLFLGGFVVTSMIFKELANPQQATFYLTLPASNLERWIAKWFLTSVGYAIATLALYTFFSALSVLIGQVVFHHTRILFNPFDATLWMIIGQYVILHSIFFLGAVTFKRNALIKTSLSLALLFIAISLSMVLFTYIFCPDCFVGGLFNLIVSSFRGADFLYWIVLAPFCWLVSYLKLNEVEIR